MGQTNCSIEGCGKPVVARGWCRKHYMRWRTHGDPEMVKPRGRRRPANPVLRFWSKVDKHGPVPTHRPDLGPCWLWTGPPDKDGYGRLGIGGKTIKAHRFAWELANGPIPPGLHPDHLCRNPPCVKAIGDSHGPRHLQIVTPRENTLRGIGPSALNAVKTHCKYGHEFTPENTYIDPSGKRGCRQCRNRYSNAYKARKLR